MTNIYKWRWLTAILFFFMLPLQQAFAQAPANDECTAARVLVQSATCANIAGTTVAATQSMAAAPCNGNPDDDVWFSFVATATDAKIDLSNVTAVVGTSTDMYFQVLSGTCASTQTSLLCSDPNSAILGGLTIGQTYYIRVYTYAVGAGASFDICVTNLTAAPASCATLGLPSNNANASNRPVLTWTAVTNATSYDIYLGSANPPTTVYANVSGNATVSYAVPTTLTPGDYYWYVVPKNSAGAPTNCATNTRKFTVIAPPANDDCGGAIPLVQSATCVNTAGTTVAATQSMAAAPCNGNPDDDVWFSFVATATDAKIDLSNVTAVVGTSTDMYFQVLSGPCSSTQTSLLCSDPNSATIGGLTLGQTYYIRVYTYPLATTATFSICVTTPPLLTACATMGNPPTNSNVSVTPTLTWTAVTNATAYDIYLGSTNPPTTVYATVQGNATTSYTVPAPLALGDYYWYVVPKNSAGAPTTCATNTRKFTVVTAPINDNCGTATSIVQGMTCVNTAGTTVAATQSIAAAPCFGNPDDDVWYSFVATGVDARIDLSSVVAVVGTSTDMYFQVLSGPCNSTQVSLLCNDPNSGTITGLTIGQTYYIRVYTYPLAVAASFNICVTNITPPPSSCGEVDPVTVPAASITYNAATINWTAPTTGTPTSYVWEVRTAGAAGSGATGLAATGTATTLTANTGTVLAASTSYSVYVRTRCGTTDSSRWSTVVNFTTPCNYPLVLTTTPGSRCGTGTVTLGATTSGTAQLNWYAAATGGNALGTGTSFTTPSISTTTNYWVSASSGATSTFSGRLAPTTPTSLTGNFAYTAGVTFNATTAFTLESVDVYLTGASGTANIQLKNSGGTVLLQTGMITLPAGNPATPVVYTIPLNFSIPVGTNLVLARDPGTAYLGGPETGIFTSPTSFPLLAGSTNVGAIVNGYWWSTVSDYYFFYNWKIGGGCESPRTLVVAAVGPRPDTTVTMTGSTTICQGSSVTLNAVAGTGLTYQWLLNNVAIPGATTTSYIANAAGSYRVRISNGGCADTSIARTITVTPLPAATVTASGPTTFCAGRQIILTGPAPATGLTYQWLSNGAAIAGATNNTHTVTASGNYRLVVYNGNCRDSSSVIAVTVNPAPTAVIAATGPTSFCTGGSVTLNANTGTGFTYRWLRNSVIIAAATSASYTTTTSGAYRVIVSNGTCIDTSIVTTVNELTKPVSTITTTGSTAFCAGSTLTLTGPAPAAGITYTWLLNNIAIAGATANTYAAGVAGSYRLVVSNAACFDTSSAVNVTVNPLPAATATAGGPTAFCQGGSVTLNANTGTGLSYQWLNNTAIIAGANNATYAATASGVYQVRVINTATGCADTSKPGIPVLVSTVPSATITVTGNLTFCEGGNIRLQAATGTGFTYVWYRNTNIITGATTSAYTATTSGTYYVVITNGACVTTATSRTVVVNPLPAAAIVPSGATSFCNGGNVVLNANTGAGLTYQWQLNTINIPGATGAAYTANASGIYNVVISNGTCTNTSNNITVTVSTMPAPVITSAGAPSFCQGGSVTLNTNTAPGYTYQWLLNNGNIPGATAATYNATATGQYTVIITNGACVATSATFTVSVTPAPVATVTPSGPTSFCQGGSVALNAGRGTNYTYQWTRNTVNIPGATSWQYTAVTSGDYAVDVFDGTCPAASAPMTVSVGSIPVAVITVTSGVIMSTDPFASYQWYRNGVMIPFASAQTYTATRDGYYAVTVTDNFGCSATSPVQLITALDVETLNGHAPKVSIWPNPADGIVQINADIAVDVTLLSVDGKQVLSAENVKTIDVTAFAQGLYLIRISDHKSKQLLSIQKLNRK